jgi:phage-related protein/DNA-binding XRE family transcriptional regulator
VDKKRDLLFYKDYFQDFYDDQTAKVQKKILWTLRVIEDLDRIPEIYFKHLESTDGLYEIRVQSGNDIFRIFCFFDTNNLVVIGHGFQKKTQKLRGQKKINESIMKKKNVTTLSEFIDKKVGKKGTKKRDEFESDYEAFRLGVLIQQARQEKGLTQEQVAELSGTNKSYISKLEKDLKDVRFSTLQRIITEGLGGHLEISIKF